jgi:hypothetical protein
VLDLGKGGPQTGFSVTGTGTASGLENAEQGNEKEVRQPRVNDPPQEEGARDATRFASHFSISQKNVMQFADYIRSHPRNDAESAAFNMASRRR